MDVWFIITFFGMPELWVGLSFFFIGVYFLLRGYGKKNADLKKFLVIMVPSLFLALFITQALKTAVDMPRPCIPCNGYNVYCNPYCHADNSFPSGHTATIFTVFTSGLIATRKYKKQMIIGFLIPVVVSLSRIMLGVHTPIDVAGGALIGLCLPVAMTYTYKKTKLAKI